MGSDTIRFNLATTPFLSKLIRRGGVICLAVFDVGLVAEAGSLPGGHVDGNGFLILSVFLFSKEQGLTVVLVGCCSRSTGSESGRLGVDAAVVVAEHGDLAHPLGGKTALFRYDHCRIDTKPTRLRLGGTRAPNQDNSPALFFGETAVILTSTDACDG